MSLIEAVTQAIYDVDYASEPWKKFETLHPDDGEQYRQMAQAAIAAYQSFHITTTIANAT